MSETYRLVASPGVGVVTLVGSSPSRKAVTFFPAAVPVLLTPSVLVPSATAGWFIDSTAPPGRLGSGAADAVTQAWQGFFTGAGSMLVVETF